MKRPTCFNKRLKNQRLRENRALLTMIKRTALTKLLYMSVFLTVFLTGCGFQVAGTAPYSQNLKKQSIYLLDKVSRQELVESPVIEQLYDDMYGLTETVSLQQVENSVGVVITREATSERSLSLNQALFNRHIEIIKSVEYDIVDANGHAILSNNASARRDLFEDQSNPSAKTRERQKLIDLINQDISREIVTHLVQLLKANPTVNTKSQD